MNKEIRKLIVTLKRGKGKISSQRMPANICKRNERTRILPFYNQQCKSLFRKELPMDAKVIR